MRSEPRRLLRLQVEHLRTQAAHLSHIADVANQCTSDPSIQVAENTLVPVEEIERYMAPESARPSRAATPILECCTGVT